MVVGYYRCRVRVTAASLKEKRGQVRRAIARSKHIAVHEVGDNDSLDTAVLGAATVGVSEPVVREALAKVGNAIARELPVLSERVQALHAGALPAPRQDGFIPEAWKELTNG